MPVKKVPKVYDYKTALEKGKSYCAYQERSQQEVRDKLYSLGLHRREVESAIAELITEGFLNEQRFAIAYAGGKFRINKWGRIRITAALKERKISDYCINKALGSISESDYRVVLAGILAKRMRSIREKDLRKKKHLVAQYAWSRGFEPGLVWELLEDEA